MVLHSLDFFSFSPVITDYLLFCKSCYFSISYFHHDLEIHITNFTKRFLAHLLDILTFLKFFLEAKKSRGQQYAKFWFLHLTKDKHLLVFKKASFLRFLPNALLESRGQSQGGLVTGASIRHDYHHTVPGISQGQVPSAWWPNLSDE